jgi:mono/diheme cytochrome c family protein
VKKHLIPALCLVWLSAWLSPTYAATDSALASTGEYLAKAGDCAACHTAPGGKPFAGGLKMVTPMGAIYSTNITPDRNSGIGRYSEAEFIRAVRGGVAQDGHRLYPAMPFPSYAKISDEDMHALYTWFMQDVPAVAQSNIPSDIPWPLSMR